MSPAPAASLLRNPPPLFPRFHDLHRKTSFSSPGSRTFSKSPLVSWKSVGPRRIMAAEKIESLGLRGDGGGDERVSPAVPAFEQEVLIDDGGVAFHRAPGGLHLVLNRLSKWVVAVTFGGVVLLRHDALALWAAMGSVLNVLLSTILKQIVKQERPASDVSSGHGMPSSHAQSIFYAVIFVILSVVEGLGLSGVSAILSGLTIALGLYFSWLRVSLRYHTTSQVVVGAALGSVFSVLWFWTWHAMVHGAYDNELWVRILVVAGAVCFCGGFVSHVFRHWTKDER